MVPGRYFAAIVLWLNRSQPQGAGFIGCRGIVQWASLLTKIRARSLPACLDETAELNESGNPILFRGFFGK